MENLLPGQNFCSRLPLEAPTFEEDEAVVVKEETNGAAPAAENGEGRKKKREKRESTVETEKDGRGQSGPKSCFLINIDVIRGDKEFPR